MALKCDDYGQVCVLGIDGDFAAAEVPAAKKAFEERMDQKNIVDFVIDFEKTGFIDSEGLELLLAMKKKCEEMFGQFKLAALDDNLKKILEITRLEARFECHADITLALKTMR